MGKKNDAGGLTTESIPTSDLATYYRNPRRGNVEVIAESLERLGQYRPIVVNRGTHTGRPNEVLAGNHTLLAAQKLGWERIDAVTVDVDEETAARIVLVDNKSSDLATYDDDLLADLLQELPHLEATGWTDDELKRLTEYELPAGFTAFDESVADDVPTGTPKTYTCPECGHVFTSEDA